VFRRLFRYHVLDAVPALCGLGLVALLIGTFLGYDYLSPVVLVPAFILVTLSYVWNLQCISHNFIHNPFFASDWLNRLFSVLETLCIGVPHVLYHHYHMNHHWGDNDAKGPDGTTRDWSSIYRHSKDDGPEAFWKYCLVSFFRVEMGPVIRKVIRHGREHVIQAVVETVVLWGFWITMGVINWRYFVFFYLPSYYLGWVISYAEGYLEHYKAQPGNPFANSVSSYHRLYNLLWFNNGYHQEHHWDPKMHWTRMKQLHEEIRPQLAANHTRVLNGPHISGLFEDWLNDKRSSSSATVASGARENASASLSERET
jgi:fatty acid desaturase